MVQGNTPLRCEPPAAPSCLLVEVATAPGIGQPAPSPCSQAHRRGGPHLVEALDHVLVRCPPSCRLADRAALEQRWDEVLDSRGGRGLHLRGVRGVDRRSGAMGGSGQVHGGPV
jgi:hypothetical protein